MASFLDRLLDPLRRRSVSPTQTIGHPGTAVYSGYIQEIEQNQALTGRSKYKTYSDILVNTAIVSAGVRYYLNLVSKAEWRAEPASDDDGEPLPGAEEIAEKFNIILRGTHQPWHRIVRRSAMFPFYGNSVQEWTAGRLEEDDTIIGMRRIDARPQITIERWDTDINGDVQGVVQRSVQTQDELYIPRSKIIYLVDDALKDSPEGLGLFRHIADPARRLERFEQLEGYGFETDLRGVPIGRAPFTEMARQKKAGKLTDADEIKLLTPITSFIKKHIKNPALGLILDSITYSTTDEKTAPSAQRQWDIDLMKAGNTSQEAVAASIQRLNREIARIIGAETLLLGETGAGSLAMSRDKTAAFALSVSSTTKEITEGYEADFVKPLMRLNGWPMKLRPELKVDPIQFREVTEVTDALEGLARAGANTMPGDPAVNVVREMLGLPKEDPELVALDSSIRNPAVELDAEGNPISPPGLPGEAPVPKPGSEEEPEDKEEK